MPDATLPSTRDAAPEQAPGSRARGGVGASLPHDSAAKHVSGTARYTDDIPELPRTLHAYALTSPHAHAKILGIDFGKALQVSGVEAVLSVSDVPGENDIGPVFPGDFVFAPGRVEYVGQIVAAVAAVDVQTARRAAKLIEVEYEVLEPVLDLQTAIDRDLTVGPPLTMRQGDAAGAVAAAPHRLTGKFTIGGQDHFYLEGHIAYALPKEDGDIHCFSSTQHPSEVQHLIARMLGRPDHAVVVEVRRMGGGFGGKETQPALIACIASLLADKTGRPVKYRLDRDDDMIITGKRHPFRADYSVGFDDDGMILGLDLDLYGDCGMSADLSNAVVDRAMFHADNCYYLPNARITGHRIKTNKVSNTAYRGFGGPQGMVAIEYIVDHIARTLGLDPMSVRERNHYGPPGSGRSRTPYHQDVRDFILPQLVSQITKTAEIAARRAEIDAFNAANSVLKRGMAYNPVKFGISFTATHLNQAGALVHVYQDGSIQVNHGGTEMGQGVYQKVAQVVAEEFGVDIGRVRITATTTEKVPNTSPTAASSGSDLNGWAARNACRAIRNRMIEYLCDSWKVAPESIVFEKNSVRSGAREMSFSELAKSVYMARISLSASGFYRTPKIWWDRKNATGRPFYYFAYGVAVTEVMIDTLTGEYRFLRADLLHDAGKSLNPAIDKGQLEGAYVQGLGWLTVEELVWDAKGALRTHAPSTYKIPTSRDVPEVFNVALAEGVRAEEETIYRSKAVGEPPFMLGISGFLALKDAVGATAEHRVVPDLDAPATPERVLFAVEDVRRRDREAG